MQRYNTASEQSSDKIFFFTKIEECRYPFTQSILANSILNKVPLTQ
jgi:hypothetical protein